MSKCRVHSGVDGDIPDMMDKEGTTANVTNGMERAALSVHTVAADHHPTSQGRTCHFQVLEMKIVSPC
jgi:hypothetical protein